MDRSISRRMLARAQHLRVDISAPQSGRKYSTTPCRSPDLATRPPSRVGSKRQRTGARSKAYSVTPLRAELDQV